MHKKAKGLVAVLNRDQRGSYFVEMALVLIGVAMAVFFSASNLSTNGIAPKYSEITTEIQNVDVPDLTP